MQQEAGQQPGSSKTELGQFYTTTNPFKHPQMLRWLQERGAGARWLEPFAGANNIVRMVQEVLPGSVFVSYDIEPGAKGVQQRDTLTAYPQGFDAVVTNPPYLARNSARRRGLTTALEVMGEWEDLYLRCLEECLAHTKHVAAIIPESFIVSGAHRERLECVISLNEKMFDDTEHPVCLAMFSENRTGDFEVWVGTRRVGMWSDLTEDGLGETRAASMRFNDKKGRIGLMAVDNTKGASIEFVHGTSIPAEEIKHSSRHRTRIHVAGFAKLGKTELAEIIETANEVLAEWRERTGDVLMSPFMGLREDGVYRRRLSYATAAKILTVAGERLGYFTSEGSSTEEWA